MSGLISRDTKPACLTVQLFNAIVIVATLKLDLTEPSYDTLDECELK